MATINKQGRMQNFINYRMRVTLADGRQMAGQMLAFDKHMNLVIADTEEFRRTKRRVANRAPGAPSVPTIETEERRSIGLTIIRGANVVSISVDGPPPADPASRLGPSATSGPGTSAAVLASGPGAARPAGRGVNPALTGPAAGVGPGPAGFGGFPPTGGFQPPFAGRGGPPGGFAPPGFPGGPAGFPPGGPPPGFNPNFPPGPSGRGMPPPGYRGGGRSTRRGRGP